MIKNDMKTYAPRRILIFLIGVTCLFTACTGRQTNAPTAIPSAIPTTTLPDASITSLPTTTTPVLPTVTPTPKPPTATPIKDFALATSPEEILGTWYEGNLYIRFDEDGTFRQANALSDLESQPYAICSFQFEGTKMIIKEISVSGVPSCGNKIGNYEVRKLTNGNIKIVTISDACPPRAGDTSGEKKPAVSPAP